MKVRNMTEGRPLPLLLAVALPLMLGNMFQQLYNVVDTQVVGMVEGVDALAALGSISKYFFVFIGTMSGFSQGFTIPLAQRFGAKDYPGLRRCLGNIIVLAAIIAGTITLLAFVSMPLAFEFLGVPEEIRHIASAYMSVIVCALPISTCYNLMAGILRALGNGKTPFFAMVVASVVNLCLDLLFVVGFRWGVTGAAIATALAQTSSCIFCFINLRKIDIIHLSRGDFKLEWSLDKRLLRLSLPVALQMGIIGFGGMVVQSVVNNMGITFIAGYTAASKLHGLLEIASSSYGFAVSTYAGQNLGAGKLDRVRKGVHVAALLGVVTSAAVAVFMFVFGRLIISTFLSGAPEQVETAMKVGTEFLYLMSACLPAVYILHVYRASLQGLGNTVVPMLSGFLELTLRVSAVLILPGIIGYRGILWAEVLAWMAADLLLVPSYYYTMYRKKSIKAV